MRASPISEPDITAPVTAAPVPVRASAPRVDTGRSLFRPAAFALFLGLVLLLQWLGGAYRNEFAGYPDEGAHYITGLMMRDYVAAHKFVSFRQYAENYYLHYPKVALGHWPPFFYIVEAVWTLVFPTSRASLLFLMALFTAAMGFSLYRILEDELGRLLALAAALLLIAVPVVQAYSGMVMADTLVSLLGFWAALVFARFMDSQKWQDAGWFGLLASLAILTKGTGVALALIPPLALLFTGRWRLMRRPAFWLPVAIVVPLCGPWYWFTRHMLPDTWQQPKPGLHYMARAFRFYALHSLHILGIALLALAVFGWAAKLLLRHRQSVQSKWAALAALVISATVVALVVPAGFEERFLIPVIPAVLAFAVAGLDFIARRLPGNLTLSLKREVLLLPLLAFFLLTTFYVPKPISFGFASVAEYILSQPELAKAVTLVSSDATGDGMFISEMAMREARPGHFVLRATKALCDCSWSGDQHGSRYSTPEALMNYFDHSPVQVVVEDQSLPSRSRLEFPRVLAASIAAYPQRWKLLGTYPITREGSLFPDGLRVYSISGTDPAAPVNVDVHRMLNKSIQLHAQ